MFEISSNFDADTIKAQFMAAAHDQLAEAAADAAIERGLRSAEDIDRFTFELSADSDEIDLAMVERRAREILRQRLS